MWSLTSILFDGLVEKFPDLEFITQEGGIV